MDMLFSMQGILVWAVLLLFIMCNCCGDKDKKAKKRGVKKAN
jgi:hypothetical protein